ncbi:hypothetical protein [Yinghuangia soli]|uniref:WxL domain-containing protein n=1 Tax=Yinghuangia soli TaxID=2908204 RepID=A0AA41Q7H9_9ACTN|nr:hypothetical protein [Yinghuangia soli]MCF2532646.1 hypothetical protein [Yinghuangia soli]
MLRRLALRRSTSAVAAGALALAGVVAVLAPSASAGTVTPTVHCVLPAGQGEATGPQSITVELDPASVQPGGAVKGKVTLGESPAKSTVSMPNIPTTPTIELAMKGAATGSVVITGPEIPISVEAGKPVPIPPYEGTFNIPAAATEGTIEFTVVKMVTYTKVFGNVFETPCTMVSGAEGTVATVAVTGSAGEQPTVKAADGQHLLGSEVAVTGAKWTPNAPVTASLCNADGSACSAGRFTASTLTIDAQGNLGGNVKLAATGIPDGVNIIKVSDGVKEASGPLETKLYVAGARNASADPNSGPVGLTVTVSGTEWSPNRAINISGVNAEGAPFGVVNTTTTPDGKFSVQWTVDSDQITQIRVREGTSSVNRKFLPFTVTTGPLPEKQDVSVTLAPGKLSMSQAASGIDFGSATLNGTAQQLNAPLNQVTVVDARGGNLGWSLTGTMTDLVAGNGTDKIPAGNIAWAPSCAAAPGSLSQVSSGSAGPLGSAPATLCSQAADSSKATGGKFTADAQLTLTTPEFAAAGSYTGTLTLSLA